MLLCPRVGLTSKHNSSLGLNGSLLQVVKAQRAAAAGQGLSSSSKAAEQVQYFDVVEYAPPQQPQAGPTRLGVVQEVAGGSVLVAPLVEEVANPGIWVADDAAEEQEVPAGNVLQIVEHVFSQMQDTEHNPHGEHAHDVWQVIGPLPARVFKG
ncbi:hypothetical protein OEZ86_002963 [Tetradesmus obliquus]|nr:hypothetical protein OEZ86_002963 [Tetradesmus obliquus]